jgi:hypothetical protein
MRLVLTATLLVAASRTESVHAQAPPDYGLTWRTVGDPGNPAADPAQYMYLQGAPPVGQVNYTYRLTQTEVTYGQWLEFVDVYSRVNPNVQIDDPAFRSYEVHYSSPDPNNHGWYVTPGAENAPAHMGWFYAARYVNWLQNGKAMNAAAFETGVYDMSSFRQISGSRWEGQTSRAAGAQFWIPSWSEWDKGMHWDPDKQGPGQGGYWLYPNSSDSVPIGGLPGTPGAQTSAGDYPNRPLYLPVGSYPDQQSPWGLLDGSGGAVEYLDGWDSIVWTRGARLGGSENYLSDRLDIIDLSFPTLPFGGLRIASVVPAPGLGVPALVLLHMITRRNRQVG